MEKEAGWNWFTTRESDIFLILKNLYRGTSIKLYYYYYYYHYCYCCCYYYYYY